MSACCKLISGMYLLLVLTGMDLVDAREKTGSNPGSLTETPLHIIADKMIALQEDTMVEFIGNVRAVQEDTVLLAQSVKIYFYPSGQAPETPPGPDRDRVKKMVAENDVEYTAGERTAFADKAVYTTADDILVLTGKTARLLTGSSWVSGTKITLFRKDDRAMVESEGNARVQALFNPEDKPAD